MTINGTIPVVESALWPQGDIRDPLGIWGGRGLVTGDASGGSVEVTFRIPAGDRAAYLYTCYSVNVSILAQAVGADGIGKCRLLTNWPDIDETPGVQGYGSNIQVRVEQNTNFDAPIGATRDTALIQPNDRFILLFDPRQQGGTLDIVGAGLSINTLNDTYAFEAYGYFWDRSVLNAPGGPRHPGSS